MAGLVSGVSGEIGEVEELEIEKEVRDGADTENNVVYAVLFCKKVKEILCAYIVDMAVNCSGSQGREECGG